MQHRIIIDEENHNQRIDIALSNLSKLSRSMIQKIIYANKVILKDLQILKSNHKVQIGEEYILEELESNLNYIKPEEGELNILYEDEHIIVLNKQSHLIVHPGAGNYSGTLVNYLSNYCKLSNIREFDKLGVVHRLDKGVSGCIVFAKTNEAHVNLNEQFQNKQIEKIYYALCYNKPSVIEFISENYIKRCENNRQKMRIDEIQGKHSISHFKFIQTKFIKESNIFISLIQCKPITGRTHQLRVHLASNNLPIIGDALYSKKNIFKFNRILLHAFSLKFTHPIFQTEMIFTAPMPQEFDLIK